MKNWFVNVFLGSSQLCSGFGSKCFYWLPISCVNESHSLSSLPLYSSKLRGHLCVVVRGKLELSVSSAVCLLCTLPSTEWKKKELKLYWDSGCTCFVLWFLECKLPFLGQMMAICSVYYLIWEKKHCHKSRHGCCLDMARCPSHEWLSIAYFNEQCNPP